MYTEHPEFKRPPDDAILWRYMSFTKFVALLHTNALFFARADKLGDPFEGSFSPVNLRLRPHWYQGQLDPDILPIIFRNLRRFHLINCWHENPAESEAMWRLYGSLRDGIVIKTTFYGLSSCLRSNEMVSIGRVDYIDYSTTAVQENNAFAPFLVKRLSFAHEREVRAMFVKTPEDENGVPLVDRPDVCEVGIEVPIKLSQLVDEVVVAPFAERWLLDLTQAVTSRFDLHVPVRRSSLAEPPVW